MLLKMKITYLIGRVKEYKGVGELLKAFENIMKKYGEKIHLTIVGSANFKDAPEDDFIKQVLEFANKYSTYITITGFVPYTEIKNYYYKADEY